MGNGLLSWINRAKNTKIILSFSDPKTPTQVRKELGISKFSIRPFLKRELLECLNPEGSKGRLYVLTNKARAILKNSTITRNSSTDYALIGWILASPRQRYVVLKTLSINSERRTSEEIRIKSSGLNPCLSRISTKSILQELIDKGLVDTEMGSDRRRYYWINEEGKSLANDLPHLSLGQVS